MINLKPGNLYKFKKEQLLFVANNDNLSLIKHVVESDTPFMFLEISEEMRLNRNDRTFIKVLYKNNVGWILYRNINLIEEY